MLPGASLEPLLGPRKDPLGKVPRKGQLRLRALGVGVYKGKKEKSV